MTGTGVLLRIFLRRDRLMILAWSVGGMLLYWTQAISVKGLYATQAEFDRAAALMETNAAFIAMAGPARALNTVGGQVTWQATAFGAIVAGLMSMFLVGRHTRAEEESGRDELVRAGAVARRAPLAATLLVAVAANVLMGALVAASLVSVPLAVADSVALGMGLTLGGLLFAGVALVAAQLTSSTRATYGLTGAVMAAAYALRAVGDVGNEALSWLSPIGWYQRMYAFSGLRWWPALLLVAAAAATIVAAISLFERRDVGSGLLAARPGRARSSRALGTPAGLPWRLQRGSLIGWSLGLALTGLSYGALGDDMGDLLGDSEGARQVMVAGGGDLVGGFHAAAMSMLALMTCGFAVASVLRPRAEETAGHGEHLLATGLSRSRWLAGHLSVTVLGTVVVLGLAGLGLGAGFAATTGDTEAVLRLTGQTLSWVPAVLVLAAVTLLLHGLSPRLAGWGWAGLGFAVAVLVLGEVLRFPDWLRALSPFEHLALVPVEPFDPVAFLVVLGFATLVAGGGWLAFTRRDVG